MRELHTAIIHCSATPEGKDVRPETIRQWHLQRGWRDIGYHFVITLDGVVHIGRPLEEVGAHAKGHNRGTIGICYVGGVDENLQPKDTLNDKQEAAIQALLLDLKRSYGITQVIGHNEVSDKACPSFVVSSKFSV